MDSHSLILRVALFSVGVLGCVFFALGLGSCAISNAKLELPAGGTIDLAALASDPQFAVDALGEEGLAQAQTEGFHLYWISGRPDSARATRAFGRWTIQAPAPVDAESGRLLAHELTHLALRSGDSVLPLWQEEGLAELVSFRTRAGLEELTDLLSVICGDGEGLERRVLESEGGSGKRELLSVLPRAETDAAMERLYAAWLELGSNPADYRFAVLAPNESSAAEYLAAFLSVSLLLEDSSSGMNVSPLQLAAALPPEPAPTTRAQLREHAWDLLLDAQTRLACEALMAQEAAGLFNERVRTLTLGAASIGPIYAEPALCPAPRTRLGQTWFGLDTVESDS